jgi:hypothetical protein
MPLFQIYQKNDENNEDLQVHVNTRVLHLTPNVAVECSNPKEHQETECGVYREV